MIFDSLADAVPDVDTAVLFALLGDSDIHRLVEEVYCGQLLTADMLSDMAIADMIPYIRGRSFDLGNPDLDW